MAESNEYGKLDEEKIKQLTGGENITARALYQTATSYKPQFTLWLSCNDLPSVTDQSLFASDRIKVIEFNKHFTPEEQDVHLKRELCTEENMRGIFMWLVHGYRRYKSHGLKMSPSLRSVVNQYRESNDLVLQFFNEKCEQDENSNVKAKDLYGAFKVWAKSNGEIILSAKKFNAELDRHSELFSYKGKAKGMLTYYGIKFREII